MKNIKMYKSKIGKETSKLLLFIIGIQYLVPFFGHLIFEKDFKNVFKIEGISISILFVPIFLIALFIIDKVLPSIRINFNFLGIFQKILDNNKFNIIFALIYLFFALKFFNEFSISFRHHNELSDSKFVIFLFALQSYFKAYIYILAISAKRIEDVKKVIVIIVAISISLTLVSSFHIIYILLCLLVLLKKSDYLVSEKGIDSKAILSIPVLGGFVFLVLSIGIANKIGTDSFFNIISNGDFISNFVKILVIRLSTWYASLIVSFNLFITDPYFSLETVTSLGTNTFNRFLILFGQVPFEKVDPWSINRLNYLNLFIEDDRPRTGTSPGIMACNFYLPLFPFNFFIIIFYVIFIFRSFEMKIVQSGKKMTLYGLFFSYIYILSLLENPIDYLNIFSPGFIYAIFLIAGLRKSVGNK